MIQVELKTVDGHIIRGISYTQMYGLASDPAKIVPNMPGGWQLGQFHIQTATGWIPIPASNVHSIPSIIPLGLVTGQSGGQSG